MAENPSRRPQNLILSRLSAADLQLLEPDLEAVELPIRKVLERRQRRIDSVYFPESGFASVVANGADKRPIEVGIVGREGMTGLAVVLGSDRPDNDTYIQAAGQGQRMKASALRKALDRSPSLHRAMLHYVHSFLNQTTRTALANGRSKIEERLARWLLMADDRIDGGELLLTQEFLAIMLGVTRPGVTVAVKQLQLAGMITKKRSRIIILDRDALEAEANGTYVPADYT